MTDSRPVVLAFSTQQVAELTGLSYGQLAYWDREGFFKPEYPSGCPGAPYDRVYSFRDVVGLRTLSVLRHKHGVSLQHCRKVAAKLATDTARPWSEISLAVWDRRVVVIEPGTAAREALGGQYIILPLVEIITDVKQDVENLKRRRTEQFGKTARNRYVSHNATVVAGTRIPVSTVRRYLEDGYSTDAILKEYPSLTKQDVEIVKRTVAA